jgi:6-pyruvoyltetrahydropterin/6-carboxytetrahydropterin synthase
MLTVTKEFTWEMAHMLSFHKGDCKNLHGHSYKLQVTVRRVTPQELEGSSKGMVIDFSDLKQVVNREIVEALDHSFVYWEDGDIVETSIAAILQANGRKCFRFPFRPTAENMVQDFAAILWEPLQKHGLSLVKLRLYETATAFAEVVVL